MVACLKAAASGNLAHAQPGLSQELDALSHSPLPEIGHGCGMQLLPEQTNEMRWANCRRHSNHIKCQRLSCVRVNEMTRILDCWIGPRCGPVHKEFTFADVTPDHLHSQSF